MSKIPSHLPQFEDRNILILSTGEKAGNLYLARNGKIKKLYFINADLPTHASRNLIFRFVLRLFAPKSTDQEKIHQNFLANLYTTLEQIHSERKIHQAHLFCPSFMRTKIEQHLPGQTEKVLANIFIGSYTLHKPHQLIEYIIQVRNQELQLLLEKINPVNPKTSLPEKTIYNKVAVTSK